MELIRQALDLFLHLDAHLDVWMDLYGLWVYAILFTIVFCETGLVVTPLLPGDSLLFTAGALAARATSPLELHWLIILLWVAAVLGDAVNFAIGYRVGPKVFHREDSIFLNKKHLWRAQRFYEHHGGKTIVLARFIPIIRTFAPFVAGIGKMTYPRFAMFNVFGGLAWVASFTAAGYFFGNMPYIKRNFHYVIVAIIVISVIPAVVEYFRHRNAPDMEPPRETAA
ncbi:MAG: DedA family protein [Deltaproteobacteria bacterium]|nr:DedA family protein [Deltaproteobacteria bacterium]